MSEWLQTGAWLLAFGIITGPVAKRVGYWLADKYDKKDS